MGRLDVGPLMQTLGYGTPEYASFGARTPLLLATINHAWKKWVITDVRIRPHRSNHTTHLPLTVICICGVECIDATNTSTTAQHLLTASMPLERTDPPLIRQLSCWIAII